MEWFIVNESKTKQKLTKKNEKNCFYVTTGAAVEIEKGRNFKSADRSLAAYDEWWDEVVPRTR